MIGVAPEGKIVGQQISDKTQRDIAGVIRRFEPPAPVEIEYVDVSLALDLKLIVFSVARVKDAGPFMFDGRSYHRVGTTTSIMPQETYEKALLERMHVRHRWENQPAAGIQMEDLDREEILRTAERGASSGRLPETAGASPGELLDRLGLRLDGSISNAAVVLFGGRLFPHYSQCQLRMARFKGADKTEFLDNRQVNGNSFQLLDEAMLFLWRHLPVAGRIQPGLFERVDEPLFPPEALREALVNAFCHRDYSLVGGSVSLAIYDDRLEIWSDGTLPSEIKIEDLKRDHQSRPRNPLIAEVFYKRGLVEKWGRGTQKIVELCVKAGHPEPEFDERAGALGVRFLPSGYIAPHRIALDLTARQRGILQILAGEELPLRDITARLSTPAPSRTVRDDIYRLKDMGLVKAKGWGRGAVWILDQNPVNETSNEPE